MALGGTAGQGITLRGMNTPPTALDLVNAAATVAHAYAAAANAAYANARWDAAKAAAEAAAMYECTKAGK